MKLFVGKDWANKTVALKRYFSDKNTFEAVNGQNYIKVDANGYATFTLDHCSDYFITEASKLPQTGGIPSDDVAGLGALLILAGAALLKIQASVGKRK